ncbi:oligosaccharide flippase family protein [Iodobacter fluviatilis]|nr:oligosaccharide flippase family protein [Iodobacter fluviatilis]
MNKVISAFKNRELFNLVMLFFSKAGAVLVGVVFLPLYSHLLGVEQFAVLAVILSFQALLLMLDFGMSTVVGRDLALHQYKNEGVSTYISALIFVVLIYFLFTLVFGGLYYFFDYLLFDSVAQSGLAILFFMLSVLQNIITTSLVSTLQYKSASSIQAGAVLIKAICAWLAMVYIQASIDTFLIVHCLLGFIHLVILHKLFHKTVQRSFFDKNLIKIKTVFNSAKPLFLFGVAGAVALQSDKIIISKFMTAEAVSSYFFAMTFCMTPLAILGGPITQYFQPKIILANAGADKIYSFKLIKYFVLILVLVSLIFSAFLIYFREELLFYWLGIYPHKSEVANYIKILMPGLAIGALGYIPFVMLTSIKDFHFQAKLSICLTTILVGFVFLSARLGRLDLICICYALYHSGSTVSSWLRSVCVREIKEHSIFAAKVAIFPAIFFLTICYFL